MRMADLIAGLPIEGAIDDAAALDVRGIAHDSRRVEAGDLFVAMVGDRHDGRRYAPQAVARGAAAVLGRGPAPAELGVPWLSADRPRELLGPLAARVFGHPDLELAMIGVTGTNGKSTVVELVRSMLEAAGRPTASIGTLGYRFRELIFEADRTTPEASDLLRMLRAMRDAGAEAATMEVSSHALSLSRVEGVQFDVAVFTNLTRDHLDFHGDVDAYFDAKRRLFGHLKTGGRAVVNIDDPYGRRLRETLPEATTFGAGGDVSASGVEIGLDGIRGTLDTPVGRIDFHTGLLGAYNVDNIVAAAATAIALGLEPGAVRRALTGSRPLAGRLEPIDAGQPFPVLVDYAHTDAALTAAIRSARELSGRRVLVVFGCGGDRDATKRAPMGRVAAAEADFVIATSDNPRGEDPLAILAAVEEGLREPGGADFEVVVDRRAAIRRAVELADEGWALLVAGKGHEEVQIIGDRRVPFSDRAELTAALEDRFGARSAG